MFLIYPFIIAFTLVFISELGDKTQLLALSFSSKLKISTILLGVALGSLFSHGLAILFGSFLGNIEDLKFQNLVTKMLILNIAIEIPLKIISNIFYLLHLALLLENLEIKHFLLLLV